MSKHNCEKAFIFYNVENIVYDTDSTEIDYLNAWLPDFLIIGIDEEISDFISLNIEETIAEDISEITGFTTKSFTYTAR